ncbi:hypothetical protein HK104_004568 [Borealophlyctis nickersoniae]|nr:hypothetical protein HK104_004568 [Borealophlyctis nickersoniae]
MSNKRIYDFDSTGAVSNGALAKWSGCVSNQQSSRPSPLYAANDLPMVNRTCRLLIYARRSVGVWRTPPSWHLSVASATGASTSKLAETEAAVPTVPTQPASTPPSSQFAKSSVVGRNLSDIDAFFAPAAVVWTDADTELLRSSVARYGRQRVKGHWSALEDAQLLEALIRAQHIKWVKLVEEDPTLPSRGPVQIGNRWNSTLKPAMMGRLWAVIKSTAKDSAERKNALAAMRGTWNPVKIKVLKDLAQARRELAEKGEAVPPNHMPFTEEEDEELWKLCSGVRVRREAWKDIQRRFPGRSVTSLSERFSRVLLPKKLGWKRGRFSYEEDETIVKAMDDLLVKHWQKMMHVRDQFLHDRTSSEISRRWGDMRRSTTQIAGFPEMIEILRALATKTSSYEEFRPLAAPLVANRRSQRGVGETVLRAVWFFARNPKLLTFISKSNCDLNSQKAAGINPRN